MISRFLKQGFTNLLFWWRQKRQVAGHLAQKDLVQKEIDNRYLQIGKQVYLNRANLDAIRLDCEKLCKQIAKLETAALAIEQDILLEQEQDFPDHLGQKQISFALAGEQSIICRKCKAKLPDYALYCGNCGVQLNDGKREG
ncbi:MAG TPA: hypothetical protein ENN77_02430 [Candidatus Wirthbacteria bacterium]|nr:hypothetical protein [Candidatus Wirthbacteria bacterium]